MKTSSILLRAAVVLLLSSMGGAAIAADPTEPFEDLLNPMESNAEFDYDDSGDKPWREGAVELPSLPADDQLLRVQLDTLPASMQAYISPARLDFDPDGRVFRFWLIIKSTAGAYNATYEGLRCDTQEYRVYGYGNPRRQPAVRVNSSSSWQALGGRQRGNYRRELGDTLMCNEARRSRPLRDIVATLKGQGSYLGPSPEFPNY